MIAVLLCAGFGTRLHPLTCDAPKPLLPVAGRPLLDYLMDSLLSLPELDAIHLISNARDYSTFLQWQRQWQRRLAAADITMHIHNDGARDDQSRRGACTDLAVALERAPGWTGALVSAGDNLYRFPLAPLWRRFRAQAHHCVTVLREPDLARRRQSGVALLGKYDRLLQLQEKPHHPRSHWICLPLYFLRPSAEAILGEILQSASTPPDAPGHFIAGLCLREPVRAFKPDGDRLNIGNLEDYRDAERQMRPALPRQRN
jgi:NDP-sugar pyrophosphorylase family protein